MIKNIEMEITNENLVEYANTHNMTEFAVVIYDKDFDMDKLTDGFRWYKAYVYNDTLSLYIDFKNDSRNNYIKVCSIGDNEITVRSGILSLLIMRMKLPSNMVIKKPMTTNLNPLNPLHIYNHSKDNSSVSLSLHTGDNDTLRGITPTEMEINCPTFANIELLPYLTSSKHIIIS